MTDSSKRFITIALALGILVLVVGIALGERAGDRVIGQVTEKRLQSIAPVTVTPAPVKKTAANPYGPDWKRTDVMAAAGDPGFPDPRVPVVVPPTPAPAPKRTPAAAATPVPTPTPTPNMNIPIWRRAAPLPTATPEGTGSPAATESGSASPEASATPSPQPGG